jgi:hypothetical protein
MTLNISVNVSFDNLYDWKAILERVGELINSMRVLTTANVTVQSYETVSLFYIVIYIKNSQ